MQLLTAMVTGWSVANIMLTVCTMVILHMLQQQMNYRLIPIVINSFTKIFFNKRRRH